jgi:hypothetical protein
MEVPDVVLSRTLGRAFGAAAPTGPSAEAALANAPNDAHSGLRSDIEDPAGRSEAQSAEDIRRRQIMLITRYVMMVRAR